jgi:hypothetical protein
MHVEQLPVDGESPTRRYRHMQRNMTTAAERHADLLTLQYPHGPQRCQSELRPCDKIEASLQDQGVYTECGAQAAWLRTHSAIRCEGTPSNDKTYKFFVFEVRTSTC